MARSYHKHDRCKFNSYIIIKTLSEQDNYVISVDNNFTKFSAIFRLQIDDPTDIGNAYHNVMVNLLNVHLRNELIYGCYY
jgi:hypothetical protein